MYSSLTFVNTVLFLEENIVDFYLKYYNIYEAKAVNRREIITEEFVQYTQKSKRIFKEISVLFRIFVHNQGHFPGYSKVCDLWRFFHSVQTVHLHCTQHSYCWAVLT